MTQTLYTSIKASVICKSEQEPTKYLVYNGYRYRYNSKCKDRTTKDVKFEYWFCCGHLKMANVSTVFNCKQDSSCDAYDKNIGDIIDCQLMSDHSNNCTPENKVTVDAKLLDKFVNQKEKINKVINYTRIDSVNTYIEDLIIKNLKKLYKKFMKKSLKTTKKRLTNFTCGRGNMLVM